MRRRPRTKLVLSRKNRRCSKCGALLNNQRVRCKKCGQASKVPGRIKAKGT